MAVRGRKWIGKGAHAARGHFGNSPLMVAVVVRERGEAKWKGVDYYRGRTLPRGQGMVRL